MKPLVGDEIQRLKIKIGRSRGREGAIFHALIVDLTSKNPE
jgi:hypothetical protein